MRKIKEVKVKKQKFLVQFIPNWDREKTRKRSYYTVIVCDSYEPDISGMVTLKNCLIEWSVEYKPYRLSQNRQGEWIVVQGYSWLYSFSQTEYVRFCTKEEQIIVNREDISSMKEIDETEVSKYINEINQEEAAKIAKRLESESKLKAEEELAIKQSEIKANKESENKPKKTTTAFQSFLSLFTNKK